jgi:hypothetical protein
LKPNINAVSERERYAIPRFKRPGPDQFKQQQLSTQFLEFLQFQFVVAALWVFVDGTSAALRAMDSSVPRRELQSRAVCQRRGLRDE